MIRFILVLIIAIFIFSPARLNGQCSGPLSLSITGSGTGGTATTANSGGNKISKTGDFTMNGNTPATGETGTWSVVNTTSTTTPVITDIHSPTTTVTGVSNLKTATLRWTITNGACVTTSDIVVSTDYALPVELLQFTGQKQNQTVVLTWITVTEKNNSKFIIEKSFDGNFFTALGEIKGAGNSLTEHIYQFVDETPANGINYYRLRSVDFAGQFTFSNIISINFFTKKEATIFPNPTSDILNIKIATEASGNTSFEIINLRGQVARREKTLLKEGVNLLNLNLSDLPVGTYFIRFQESFGLMPIKFVKN